VIYLANLIANLFGPGKYGSRLRSILLNMLGNRISMACRFAGGGFVHGRQLTVGARSFVGLAVYFDLTEAVTLDQDVVVGHGVTFVTADHVIGSHERRCGTVVAKPIRVECGAWIAANATIMPGVTIGAGAIVAAGSLVRHDVAPDTLVAGVPARIVRTLQAS
jgi:acetyltransferase-like isoleucine patch superfamily enzyme